jgi:hypothetical protein
MGEFWCGIKIRTIGAKLETHPISERGVSPLKNGAVALFLATVGIRTVTPQRKAVSAKSGSSSR